MHRRELGDLRIAVMADLALTGGDAPPDVLPARGDEHLVPGFRRGEQRGRSRLVGVRLGAHF